MTSIRPEYLDQIFTCVQNQTRWRGSETLNMIASENQLSKTAMNLMNNDFHHRYAEGLIGQRAYQGQKFHDQIEQIAVDLSQSLFHADFVDVRCPSATIANLAIYYAFCKPGDLYYATTIPDGAHISYREVGAAGYRGLVIHDIPYDSSRFNINVDALSVQLTQEKPKLLTLGGSVFLFPHPVKEIAKICQETQTILHYDASHVLGLIAGHEFQDPLKEGADCVIGSTHKTFPGPQGAIVLANNTLLQKKEKGFRKIQQKIFPGVVSNHHLWRLPALAVTLLEMKEFGTTYAHQIVLNAQSLGKALDQRGIPVLAKKLGYTQSHQLILDVHAFGGGGVIAHRLEEANIICNKNTISGDDVNTALDNPSGLRIGTQELTRLGMKDRDMKNVADFFARIIINEEPSEHVKRDVLTFRRIFSDIHYSFDLPKIVS